MPRTVTIAGRSTLQGRPGRSMAHRFLARLAHKVEYGQLLIEFPSGETLLCEGKRAGPKASVVLGRWRAVRRLVIGGDIGFAEAYMDGDWSSPDLTSLIELAAYNFRTLVPAMGGTWLSRLAHRLWREGRANSKRGSRRNIPAHYDLGNEFYAAWLDPAMNYSSGLYESGGATLEQAQAAKQGLAIDFLELSRGERVLEIGCGWGSLAARLAREHGCDVIGLTLSPSQLTYARGLIDEAGAGTGRVELLRLDYRDAVGTFDRVVSIEMLEAVGKEYWNTYFSTVHDRLRPGGIAALQVITMADERYKEYERGTDFIQRHIFPGGMLPSPAIMRERIAAAGLQLECVRNFGASYGRTLAEWRARFLAAWPRLRLMGFDETFRRKWEYYLAYCEAGFRAGAIDVGIYQCRRPAVADLP